MGGMMLKQNLLMLPLSANTFSVETLPNTWNYSLKNLKSTKSNSEDTKMLVLVLVTWKPFTQVFTKLFVLTLLLKSQRDTTNKDFPTLKERTRSDKNLPQLPRR